jgi:ABC-type transport system involved in cytochrome bd biosynthesis fused ATPase/permease subunit
MNNRSGLKVMTKLIGLVKPLTGFMLLAVIMGLIGHLCATFITVFGGYAVLELMGYDTAFNLTVIFVSVIVFAVVRGLLRYAEQACNHFIAFKLLALIRDKIFGALRKLCPAKLEGKDKGNLISVITSDIELLEVFYAHTISPAMIALFFVIIMSCFIGSFHIALGAVALTAYLAVGIIIPVIMSRLSKDAGIKFRTKSGKLSSFVLDSLRGLSEILQYAAGDSRLEEMNKMTDELLADEEKMKRVSGINTAATNTVILLFDIIMLFSAAFLLMNGRIGFDGVLIPVLALMSSFGPVVALANLGSTLQNTFAAGNRVLDILEETPVVEEVRGRKRIDFLGAWLKNVTFSYNEERILDNVSIDFPQNCVIGIEGKSGSGKSTILKLLMRFWDVNKGKVNISGTDIDKINTDNLRDMESFMTQETYLFHDTIKNNIKIAKLDASDEEIIEACKKASVHDFITKLPKGYDTDVGELGDAVSGGEMQRIGLARVFLHKAPFILLDEPTSNLDSLNEAVILKSLSEAAGGKTVVLVSHRQSTMRIADRVYSVQNILKSGRRQIVDERY